MSEAEHPMTARTGVSETLTDVELDAWLAEHLFGWTPPFVPMPGDKARTFKPDEWMDEAGWSNWPGNCSWSSTGDGMLLVIEAMWGRGFGYDVDSTDGIPLVTFHAPVVDGRFAPHQRAEAATLPRAVAEAARAALEASRLDAVGTPSGREPVVGDGAES